ncbi:acid protease [Coniophora puteana RWD-64-598 SS2]|uniref:Acid protease n=1 Tax=Coniophora puteana (strain RWD-64-598) TaxID=741705 RepID=A0A5M3MFH2_CONPW|nr:acid protease [Coniophora puteana RWD-64-598 SS2]EIW77777.1 acid protease [Coniophora puteana RWD-64-598 SS2]
MQRPLGAQLELHQLQLGRFDLRRICVLDSLEDTYGSGAFEGTLVQDTVKMGGFTVSSQQARSRIRTKPTAKLFSTEAQGLMGSAWKTLAQAGTPFWLDLVETGQWDEPLMALQLTRFGNHTSASDTEPGGSFTMGYTNSSLFTGSIEYHNLTETPTWWVINISAEAMIDSGTTLIYGPASTVEEVYSIISYRSGLSKRSKRLRNPANTQNVARLGHVSFSQ